MLETIIFFVFASIAVIFGIVVITHRNPVVSAISLVASLFSLAVMYVLLEAPFIAALQVIVYAGAIMVLFLFVIMLLNLQLQKEERTRPIQQFLGWFGSAAFGMTMVYYIAKAAILQTIERGPFMSDVRSLGIRLFEAYVFPFEMVSILLLSAIVGSIVLTQRGPAGEVPRGDR